jgi:hypothetical protein
MTSPVSIDDHHHHIKKKRVGKACDSCRIKKTKCDGKKPCNRCLTDNKICIFTDKKKLQQKTYPSGYVELLETRIELLTKSLEKLIELSKYNLPFLQKLAVPNPNSKDTEESGDEDSGNESTIPINEVVLYLINNENLFQHLPVEWEKGAMIAAKYNERTNSSQSIKQFADHKCKSDEYSESSKSPVGCPTKYESKYRPNEDSFSKSSLMDERTNVRPPRQMSSPRLTDTINLNDYSLGGFSLGVLLANSIAGGNSVSSSEFTDFESDSNSNFSKAGMNSSIVNEATKSPRKSLFFDEDVTSNDDLNDLARLDSYSSLTNKFQSQQLTSPPSEPLIRKCPDDSNVLRRVPSSSRSYSPSNIKGKGFIHKRPVTSSHHKHVVINPNSPVLSASNYPASLFNNFNQKKDEEPLFDQTFNENPTNGFTNIGDVEQEYGNESLTPTMGDYNNSTFNYVNGMQPTEIMDGSPSELNNLIYSSYQRQ